MLATNNFGSVYIYIYKITPHGQSAYSVGPPPIHQRIAIQMAGQLWPNSRCSLGCSVHDCVVVILVDKRFVSKKSITSIYNMYNKFMLYLVYPRSVGWLVDCIVLCCIVLCCFVLYCIESVYPDIFISLPQATRQGDNICPVSLMSHRDHCTVTPAPSPPPTPPPPPQKKNGGV